MDHIMLADGLMEVRGAESEVAACKYAVEKTGLTVDTVIHIVAGMYQVALR